MNQEQYDALVKEALLKELKTGVSKLLSPVTQHVGPIATKRYAGFATKSKKLQNLLTGAPTAAEYGVGAGLAAVHPAIGGIYASLPVGPLSAIATLATKQSALNKLTKLLKTKHPGKTFTRKQKMAILNRITSANPLKKRPKFKA